MNEDSLENFVRGSLKAINPSVTEETIKEVLDKTREMLQDPVGLAKHLQGASFGKQKMTTDDFLNKAVNEAGKRLRNEEEE